MPSSQPRQVSSLYLDEIAVSVLNGALPRATGNTSARMADLVNHAERALHAIGALEPTLATGHMPGFADRTASWWHLPNDALHGDLTTYTETWRRAMCAWRPELGPDHVGVHMLALSVLSHRAPAWSVPTPRYVPPPFARRHRRADPAYGPYPRRLGEPPPTLDDGGEPTNYRPSFVAHRLTLHRGTSSKSHSIAVDREAHLLARLLVGKDVLHWLVKHWAGRFNRIIVTEWTDAALYAAQALLDERCLAEAPAVLDSIEATRLQFLEEDARFDMPDSDHARRLRDPAGTTAAARTVDAFDVAFSDFDGHSGYVAVEVDAGIDLRALGFLVMAKRLGILDDEHLDLRDVIDLKRRFLAELGLEPTADVRAWTDALLATVDQRAPTVRVRVAAAWHADRILEAYLRDKSDTSPPNSFVTRLARGSTWAWPDRWALDRFFGFPLDAPLDGPETWSKRNLEMPTRNQARRLNQILGHMSGPDTDPDWHGWSNVAHRLEMGDTTTVTITLDDTFAIEAMRRAQRDGSEREAALELLRWSTQRS